MNLQGKNLNKQPPNQITLNHNQGGKVLSSKQNFHHWGFVLVGFVGVVAAFGFVSLVAFADGTPTNASTTGRVLSPLSVEKIDDLVFKTAILPGRNISVDTTSDDASGALTSDLGILHLAPLSEEVV